VKPPQALTEIRRSDAIVDLLARRHARPSAARRHARRLRALGDPAVTLLSSLAADVDAGPPAGAARPRPAGAWRHAVVAVATAVAVLTAAGLLVATVLARLAAAPGSRRVRRRP
jgi:O-antigen ligase